MTNKPFKVYNMNSGSGSLNAIVEEVDVEKDGDRVNNVKDMRMFKTERSRSGAIKMWQLVILWMNGMIGTGFMKVGFAVRTGVGAFVAVLILMLLVTQMSNWFMYQTALVTDCYSYDDIWAAAYGHKTRIIPVFVFMLVSFGFVSMYYVNAAVIYEGMVLHTITAFGGPFYYNRIFVLSCFWLVGVAPCVFLCRTPLRMVGPSIVALVSAGCLVVYAIYVAVGEFNMNGFDPQKKMEWFDGMMLADALASLNQAFLFAPINLVALRAFPEASVTVASRASWITVLTGAVLYSAIGLLTYFTLFDVNTGEIFMMYFETGVTGRFIGSRAVNIMSLVAGWVLMATSTVVMLQPGTVTLMSFVGKSPEVNWKLHVGLQLVCSFIMMLVGCVDAHISVYWGIFIDIGCFAIVFFLPQGTFFKIRGKEDKMLFAIAVGMCLFGAAISIFTVFYTVWNW